MFKFLITRTMGLIFLYGCSQPPVKENVDIHKKNTNSVQNSHILNCVKKSGHHVYEKKMTCPLSGEDFTSLNLGTHSTSGKSLDWEPLSYMRFPVPLPVCPSNGFVMVETEYAEKRIEKIRTVIESEQYIEMYKHRHATYFLYAKTLELSGEETESQWWLYLNATWEADHCNDETRYKEYALLVIEESKARLTSLASNSEEFWVLSIVIPNMYRRIGEFDKANKYLDGVGDPSLKNQNSNNFYSLAKRLLATAIANNNSDRVAIREEEKT
ncbi:MAG: hypothetical protein COA86_17580 [Kangiella sp.]|nr:MAG: hypothetical protein COA86_17580 [Kangiella sp.]